MAKLKPGRKPTNIDWNDVEKLCVMQCTQEEIAAWFNCSVDSLERGCKRTLGIRFADFFKEKRSKGRISLRRAMFQKALTGQPALMIFLAKNYLGMSDKVENTHSTSSDPAKKLIINFGDAKNAVEKGIQRENSFEEHKDGNEARQAAIPGGSDSPGGSEGSEEKS